tara:strand:- start:169 stop:804 length:636 start_codon:yes stop_codon:yes gene_type:complete
MRPIKTYEEFTREPVVNEKKYDYPSFQSNKGIYYQDMLISSGYWSYMGKERYGKGQYMNVDNRQMYGFSPDDIEYFKKHLKDIEVMESALYEAVKVSLDIEEPFDIKEEKKAATKYKWVPKASPITISKVEGGIFGDVTDVTIQFSNGDEIYYRWEESKRSSEIVTYNDDSYKVSEDVMDIIFGSTSTIVGDVALIYSKFKDGLNPSYFIK